MRFTREDFSRYANITREQKAHIIRAFREARRHGSDPGHATTCAAHDAWNLTDRQWNGKVGSDIFAATMAVLVMAKELDLGFGFSYDVDVWEIEFEEHQLEGGACRFTYEAVLKLEGGVERRTLQETQLPMDLEGIRSWVMRKLPAFDTLTVHRADGVKEELGH